MDSVAFRQILERTRNDHPKWFDLAQAPPAEESDINSAEDTLRVTFPREYKEFLREYGGGDVVFVEIYAAGEGDRSVVEMNRNRDPRRAGFVAISDDGTGNEYGFRVAPDGAANSRIAYLDFEAGEILDTQFDDVFAFIADKGLHAS